MKDNIKIITQLQADAMSKQIYDKPDDWFWQHKRFKQFYGEIYDE